jgi:tRNA A-37 threonylcarbamoyl transferase component Bud32
MSRTTAPHRPLPESVERLVDEFDKAWRSGQAPSIAAFLARTDNPANGAPGRRAFLEELIKIDMEYRWRRYGLRDSSAPLPSECFLLEHYLAQFPELGLREAHSLDLIGWEYHARHYWGDRPAHAGYHERFGSRSGALQELLDEIDRARGAELAAAQRRKSQPPRPDRAGPAPPAERPQEATVVRAAADLLELLRHYVVLRQVQLADIERSVSSGHYGDSHQLARDLLDRGWLTPYQVNQLLVGRCAELTVGPYLVLERLGAGGAGQVFKARHQKMERVVALKIIRKELLADAEVVGRFYREIQVLSRLDHPNIVHAFDAGPAGATHFLAMEFVEGTDLGRLVKQGGAMPALQACECVRQAALGLQHAHERGLVHRDIKPHNLIMNVRDGLTKVADLGLARLPRSVILEQTGDTTTGTLTPQNAVVIGTADYLAPEQAVDFHRADIRADIYSLGCTLYYLLTGQPPFSGGLLAEKLLKHQQAEPPPVENFRPDLPAGLSPLLRQMLAKQPADRPQTPGAVATALTRVLRKAGAGNGAANAANGTLESGPVLSRRATRGRALLLGAGLLAFFAVGAFLAVRPSASHSGVNSGSASQAERFTRSPLDDLKAENIAQADRFLTSPTNELVAVLGKAGDPSSYWISSLACCPDGTLAYVDAAGRVYRVDLTRSPANVQTTRGCPMPQVAALRADGSKLATVERREQSLQLWDVAAGKQRDRGVLAKLPAAASALAFSRDGKHLAATCKDGTVWLWDVGAGAPTQSAKAVATVKSWPRALAFAPDGAHLAFGGTHRASLYVLDLADHKEPHELVGPREDVYAVAFAPDARTLASGGVDRSVRLWNVPGFAERGPPCTGHEGQVTALAFAPQGKTFASGGLGGKVILWSSTSGKQLRAWRFGDIQGIASLTFAPDGRHLLVGARTGLVFVLRPEVVPP